MAHKDAMRRFYEKIVKRNLGVIDELLAEDFVEHDPFASEPTREGTRQFFAMALSAFPDLDMKILHMVGEGDVVIAYGRFMGTHHGEFMGIPATRRRIDVPFADVVRFREDGLAAEHWGVADSGMMMQQLGLAPGPSE